MGWALVRAGPAASTVPVPPSVQQTINERLERLPPKSVRLLRAASIVGRVFSVEVLARMVGEPVLGCLGQLDEAAAASLVEPTATPSEHRFVHLLLRDAIEAGLGAAERVQLHWSAAEALEQLYAAVSSRVCRISPGTGRPRPCSASGAAPLVGSGGPRTRRCADWPMRRASGFTGSRSTSAAASSTISAAASCSSRSASRRPCLGITLAGCKLAEVRPISRVR